MNGRQIRDAAQSYTGEAIDDVKALIGINRGIRWIASNAKIEDMVEIEVTGGEWTPLPPEVFRVVRIEDAQNRPYNAFETFSGKIRCYHSGKYIIYFRRLPKTIVDITQTPDLPEIFHDALITYLTAWWKLYDDDENPDGFRLMNQFERDVNLIARQFKKSSPKSIRVVR